MIQSDIVSINRGLLVIKPYTLVRYQGDIHRVINILNATEVVISNIETLRCLQAKITDLSAIEPDDQNSELNKGDHDISEEAWKIALERYEAIKSLIDVSSVEAVAQISRQINIHETTLWRWLKAYRENNSIMALVPKKRGWINENLRLPPQLNHIINQAINDKYLNAKKPSIAKTIEHIKAECFRQKIDSPHGNTIRQRIQALNDYEVTKARLGKKAAEDKYSAAAGTFPNADYPLAYVQIDHTPLDIEIVDDEYRQAIGKVSLTLAIDIFSRMIVGYYLSLEAPSATSVAMCIASSILSKRRKLIDLGIEADWDVEGLMDVVHSDNGPDFRTHHISKACLKYGINWEYRPIGGAKFGGHIERMLGIVNLEMHILDGTTFSNVKERGAYDSAKNACLTLKELEYYLVGWITKIYHKKRHSAIEMSPIKKWEEGVWGTKAKPGTGLKERVANEETLLLDFLPEFESTIQRAGVQKDKLFYFADCLRPWINALDPMDVSKRKKRKFTFKRDPRDISVIWFYEPESNSYYKVPTSKREIPPISLHEYKEVKKYLNSEHLDTIDQDEIFKAILHLRDHVDQARSLTRKKRRSKQRRVENSKATVIISAEKENKHQNIEKEDNQSGSDLWNTSLTAFDDLR